MIKSAASAPVSSRLKANWRAPQYVGSPLLSLTVSLKNPGLYTNGFGSFKLTNAVFNELSLITVLEPPARSWHGFVSQNTGEKLSEQIPGDEVLQTISEKLTWSYLATSCKLVEYILICGL